MTARIVVLDGATLNPGDNSWAPMESLGEFELHARSTESELAERLALADVAVVNKVRLSAETIANAPRLKFISVSATGFDCVDVKAAASRGIPVSNVPTYGTASVAQFTFALILELCHRVGLHDAAVHAGDWQKCESFSFWRTPHLELDGLTLGVIGFGRIGQRVAHLGHAFGMRVLAQSRDHSTTPQWQPFEWADRERIAAESDVISLNCSLNDETRGLVDATFLRRMKPAAFLINTSRGALVNEVALADALNAGQIAGAAVDVVSAEPIRADNPLLGARNLVMTPHMAWSTGAARRRMMQTTADNIRAFLSGRPINVVNQSVH